MLSSFKKLRVFQALIITRSTALSVRVLLVSSAVLNFPI
jgi:hypothetical protein